MIHISSCLSSAQNLPMAPHFQVKCNDFVMDCAVLFYLTPLTPFTPISLHSPLDLLVPLKLTKLTPASEHL